jgi:hypothetical protein
MSFNINLSQLSGLKARLREFGEAVKSEVAMEGVASMALVIYEDARSRVRVSAKAHYFYGRSSKKNGTRYLIQPGTLKGAIYRVYSPEKSGPNLKLYRVSWNHTKAPHGAMVEFGTSSAPAYPFMRPALSRLDDAIDAGKTRMAAKLAELGARA